MQISSIVTKISLGCKERNLGKEGQELYGTSEHQKEQEQRSLGRFLKL